MTALHFSVMYEDPAVELSVSMHRPKCLFICSAGCVALNYMEKYEVSSMCLLDSNPVQLQYVQDRVNHAVQQQPTGTYDQLFQEFHNEGYTAFETHKLVEKFGAAAVRQSSRSFAEHFRQCFAVGMPKPCNWRNYNLGSNAARISYVNQEVCDYFRPSLSSLVIQEKQENQETQEKLDLISLSNVTDWVADPVVLLALVKRHMHANSRLITRRLNSDTTLLSALEKNAFVNVPVADATGLYQETYISSLPSWHEND